MVRQKESPARPLLFYASVARFINQERPNCYSLTAHHSSNYAVDGGTLSWTLGFPFSVLVQLETSKRVMRILSHDNEMIYLTSEVRKHKNSKQVGCKMWNVALTYCYMAPLLVESVLMRESYMLSLKYKGCQFFRRVSASRTLRMDFCCL